MIREDVKLAQLMREEWIQHVAEAKEEFHFLNFVAMKQIGRLAEILSKTSIELADRRGAADLHSALLLRQLSENW